MSNTTAQEIESARIAKAMEQRRKADEAYAARMAMLKALGVKRLGV